MTDEQWESVQDLNAEVTKADERVRIMDALCRPETARAQLEADIEIYIAKEELKASRAALIRTLQTMGLLP